jgi:hypothetical protein
MHRKEIPRYKQTDDRKGPTNREVRTYPERGDSEPPRTAASLFFHGRHYLLPTETAAQLIPSQAKDLPSFQEFATHHSFSRNLV